MERDLQGSSGTAFPRAAVLGDRIGRIQTLPLRAYKLSERSIDCCGTLTAVLAQGQHKLITGLYIILPRGYHGAAAGTQLCGCIFKSAFETFPARGSVMAEQ